MAKVIQVGLGGWGFDWASTVVPTVETAEAVAYVDPAPAALEQVRSELGVEKSRCFASLTKALAEVPCDLVLATLRTDAHFPAVREALDAGVHVVVEKPFASTLDEARQLVALAEAAGRVLMVSQNYRYHPAPIAVAKLVAAEAVGRVNLVELDFRMYAPSTGYRYWEMPDPLIADMSIHHFDLMRMVLDAEPVRVSCRTWNPKGSPFTHDSIGVATVEFTDGTMVSYRASWLSGGRKTAWAGEWRMDCTDGEIAWTSRHRFAGGETRDDWLILSRRGEKEERPALPRPRHVDRAGSLAAAIEAIGGRSPPRFPSGADNLKSFALIQASLLSARRRGDWVEIAEILD